MNRLLFAAMHSGGGKTAVTCAFLAALLGRGLSPRAFKCGPDYIDSMFHRRVLGVPSRSLDLFLSDEGAARRLVASCQGDIAVLEGVMGFYDGVGGTDQASTWHTARATRTPVVLVIRPKGASLTLAAQVKGLEGFREGSGIRGLFLDDCSPALYGRLAPALERETGLPVMGFLPPMEEAAFPSRHLGLVTAEELAGWRERIGAMGRQMEQTGGVDGLLRLAAAAPGLGAVPPGRPMAGRRARIAVARDRAFCFLYEENLDRLRAAGAEIVFFSPLEDTALPPAGGLYLPGGYPEAYARELSRNRAMRDSVARAVGGGLPTVAECGGFLYLQKSLEDTEGRPWPMAGALPGEGKRTTRLQRFGYGRVTAPRGNLLMGAGETRPVHEFHYWDCTDNGQDLVMEKAASGRRWRCGFATGRLFAGFPHLYFDDGMAGRFAEAAARFEKEEGCETG